MNNIFPLLIAALIGLALVVFLFFFFRYFKLWLRSFISGAGIGFVQIVMISFRKSDVSAVVDCKIIAVHGGLSTVTISQIERHFLVGGDAKKVIQALMVAHRGDIEMDWQTVAEIELDGGDPLEYVERQVASHQHRNTD